jgi:hypothetical protein
MVLKFTAKTPILIDTTGMRAGDLTKYDGTKIVKKTPNYFTADSVYNKREIETFTQKYNLKADSVLLYQFDKTKTLGAQGWDTTAIAWGPYVTYSIVSDGLQITQPQDFGANNFVSSPVKIGAKDATTYEEVRVVTIGSHFYIGAWFTAAAHYFARWEWLGVQASNGQPVISTDVFGTIGGPTSPAIHAGDILRIYSRRNHATYSITVYNVTQNTTVTFSSDQSGVGENVNDYRPGIFLLTGTVVMRDFKVWANTFNPDIEFIAASIVQGSNVAGGYDSSYTGRIQSKSNLVVSYNGGSGDGLLDTRERINNILKKKPRFAAIGDMGYNDIINSRPYATWQADYQWLVDTLHTAGIFVVIQHQTPASPSTIPDSINAFIDRTFHNDAMTYILKFDSTAYRSSNHADALGHMTAAGAEMFATQFVKQIKNFAGTKIRGVGPEQLSTAQRNAIPSNILYTGYTIFCTDCTATDASTGVVQTYNGSAWKNNW